VRHLLAVCSSVCSKSRCT